MRFLIALVNFIVATVAIIVTTMTGTDLWPVVAISFLFSVLCILVELQVMSADTKRIK